MAPGPTLGLRISSHGVIHVVRGRAGLRALCGSRLRPIRNPPSNGVLTPSLHLKPGDTFDFLACRRCRVFKSKVEAQL